MKRKHFAILLSVVAFGFYVIWPAYAGYRLKEALDAKDPAAVSGLVDFPSLRQSLRPAATAEAERAVKEQLKKAGRAAGVLGEEIAKKALPNLIESTLDVLVTPDNIIRMYAESGAVTDVVGRLIGDQLGRTGGIAGFSSPRAGGGGSLDNVVGGLGTSVGPNVGAVPGGLTPAGSPVRTLSAEKVALEIAATPKPGYGLANIKRLGPSGPLSMEIGFAKDPSSKDADVTVEMGFTGTGWKLTGLRPRL